MEMPFLAWRKEVPRPEWEMAESITCVILSHRLCLESMFCVFNEGEEGKKGLFSSQQEGGGAFTGTKVETTVFTSRNAKKKFFLSLMWKVLAQR